MLRLGSVCGFLILCVLQVGCSSCGSGCQGCGPKYWGAYVEDPPRCEPCDCHGNWTGGGSCGASCGEPACGVASCAEPSCGVDSCCGTTDGCGSKFPWMRSMNRRASFWQMLSACNKSKNAECCQGSCSTGCTEPSCATVCEPSCGDPGCGQAGSCECGAAHAAVSRSPMRRSPMQMASHATTVDYRMSAPGGCNCGKH